MFKDFGRRLQRDVNKLINNRIKISSELAGNAIKAEPMKVEVNFAPDSTFSWQSVNSQMGKNNF